MSIILASGSASRRQMLDAAGVAFRIHPADVDESATKNDMLARAAPPGAIAEALARLKAQTVSALKPDDLVIGSDSVVSVDGRLFDKPRDREQAAQHLASFSGKEMRLFSAVAAARGGEIIWTHLEDARLLVRPLSTHFINAYLDAEWPDIAGCVGCFRMEGPGVQLFSSVRGDHFTILGMPLLPLLTYLRSCGALPS